MPAKAKVTKEMIIDAAFAIAREAGVENINARTVSERLHCSTQPVMYHFATMEELKRTVYAKADLYHSEYLMTMKKPPKSAALGIGMNYIRFAIEEPHLFRFLFQSDYFNGKTLLELIDAEELTPVLSAMQRSLGIGMEQTKTVFITVFLFAHGYASIIANNALKYDEDTINSHLADKRSEVPRMDETLKLRWLYCPRCGGKTRTQIRAHTVLEDFPLFCPKCKYTCVIRFKGGKIEEIKMPDA